MEKQEINIKNNDSAFVVGLTGGIGAGKTAAAQILKAKGAYIIDTDIISRQVCSPGTECYHRLLAAFPECVVNGVLQRPLLKQLVFLDENRRKLLNGITHPYILIATKQEILGKKWVVVQVPLLFESGFDKSCDVTFCIWADEKIRTERLLKRDGMTAKLAKAIMKAQLSKEELKQKSDYFIENDRDLAHLEESIDQFYQKIKNRLESFCKNQRE